VSRRSLNKLGDLGDSTLNRDRRASTVGITDAAPTGSPRHHAEVCWPDNESSAMVPHREAPIRDWLYFGVLPDFWQRTNSHLVSMEKGEEKMGGRCGDTCCTVSTGRAVRWKYWHIQGSGPCTQATLGDITWLSFIPVIHQLTISSFRHISLSCWESPQIHLLTF